MKLNVDFTDLRLAAAKMNPPDNADSLFAVLGNECEVISPHGDNAIDQDPCIVLVEGYSSAGVVYDAIQQSVIAVPDVDSLKYIAMMLKEYAPDKPIIIFAEDRHFGDVAIGSEKARNAAEAVNGYFVTPVFAPGEQEMNSSSLTSFYDLANHSVLGAEGVCRQVEGIVSYALEDFQRSNDVMKNEMTSSLKRTGYSR